MRCKDRKIFSKFLLSHTFILHIPPHFRQHDVLEPTRCAGTMSSSGAPLLLHAFGELPVRQSSPPVTNIQTRTDLWKPLKCCACVTASGLLALSSVTSGWHATLFKQSVKSVAVSWNEKKRRKEKETLVSKQWNVVAVQEGAHGLGFCTAFYRLWDQLQAHRFMNSLLARAQSWHQLGTFQLL